MTVEEVKTEIERQVGIPVSLLTATTPEALIEQAKALLDPEQPKDKYEQLGAWIATQLGGNHALKQLTDIAAQVAAERNQATANAAGEEIAVPSKKTTREQFEEFVKKAGYFG